MTNGRARLFCRTGKLAGATYELGSDNSVGRDDSNDVVLLADAVSGKHARISRRGRTFLLEDLGSRNGTHLDGIPVAGPVELGTLNVITFSTTFDFIFQVIGATSSESPALAPSAPDPQAAQSPDASSNEAPAPPDSQAPAPHPPAVMQPGTAPPTESHTRVHLEDFGPLPNLKGAALTPADGLSEAPISELAVYLVIQVPGRTSQDFLLKRGDNTVGRSDDCDVAVDHESLSRQHVLITVTPERLVLKDLGSTNGTFLDGREVSQAVIPFDAQFFLGAEIEARLERR